MGSNNTKTHLKTLMYMDSNRACLGPKILWCGLSMIPCKGIDSFQVLFAGENFANVSVFFIHVSVIDIVNIVNNLHDLHSRLKIVLSEITPRKIFNDNQVKECHDHLHKPLPNVAFTKNCKAFQYEKRRADLSQG